MGIFFSPTGVYVNKTELLDRTLRMKEYGTCQALHQHLSARLSLKTPILHLLILQVSFVHSRKNNFVAYELLLKKKSSIVVKALRNYTYSSYTQSLTFVLQHLSYYTWSTSCLIVSWAKTTKGCPTDNQAIDSPKYIDIMKKMK